MRLIKGKSIGIITFAKQLNKQTGQPIYNSPVVTQMLASVLPYRASMVPDFQVDLTRLKDYWMLYSNEEILSDGSQLVLIDGKYYLPVYNENRKYQDARDGYFKTIIKLNVDEAYGVQNG